MNDTEHQTDNVFRPSLVPELLVRDIRRSLDFYCGCCGFTVLYQRPQEHFAYLQRQGAEIMLDQIGATRDWAAAELHYPFGRGMNLEIAVDDIMPIYQKLNGTPQIFMQPEEKWYGTDKGEIGVRQFIAQDPDGYLLRFSQRLGARG